MKLTALIALIAGIITFLLAKSAIHEIEAFLLFIISAIMFSASYIIESIKKLDNKQN